MDAREKLVDILDHIYLPMMAGPNTIGEYRIPHEFNEEIADHLITNGVTVQECGNWKYYHKQNKAVCTSCSFERDLDTNFGKAIACPNCGAYMPQPQKENDY